MSCPASAPGSHPLSCLNWRNLRLMLPRTQSLLDSCTQHVAPSFLVSNTNLAYGLLRPTAKA
ncbi:unnamed protein product [Prunus armeniaca]